MFWPVAQDLILHSCPDKVDMVHNALLVRSLCCPSFVYNVCMTLHNALLACLQAVLNCTAVIMVSYLSYKAVRSLANAPGFSLCAALAFYE